MKYSSPKSNSSDESYSNNHEYFNCESHREVLKIVPKGLGKLTYELVSKLNYVKEYTLDRYKIKKIKNIHEELFRASKELSDLNIARVALNDEGIHFIKHSNAEDYQTSTRLLTFPDSDSDINQKLIEGITGLSKEGYIISRFRHVRDLKLYAATFWKKD